VSTRRVPAGIFTVAALMLAVSMGTPVLAQSQPAPQQQAQALLSDFIHYVRIDQREAAIGTGQLLIDQGLSAQDFVKLVDGSEEANRFADAIIRAQKQSGVEPIAARLEQLYEQGKLEIVRDPEQIKRNIALLKGTNREWLLARERLIAAGEYAMPLLLNALLQRNDPALRAQVRNVMVDMRRQALNPLTTALPKLDEGGQELVCDVLGQIQSATAVPFLTDLRAATQSAAVRTACDRALGRIAMNIENEEPADLYYWLADRYYQETAELTSFPGEGVQLLWTYDPSVGLFPAAIDTRVFHEAMGMRMSERSLQLRPNDNEQSVALWIGTNIKRELETPEGYENPAYASARRDAMYYAVASGADTCQQVLARGLIDRNTPLVREAIAALDQMAGGRSLYEQDGGRGAPLLACLQYPNRRVRYEAALALGKSSPSAEFDGSARVVPTLGSLIRDVSERYAVIVATDAELYQELRKVVESMGYTVLPNGQSLGELAGPIAEVPGVDLIVSNLSQEQTEALIGEAQTSTLLGATPVLALTSQAGYIELAREYERNEMVAIRQAGIDGPMIVATATELLNRSSGGSISPLEARDYQARALAVLRDLAVSGSTVFNIADASVPLIRSLGENPQAFGHEVAEVLAWVAQKRAQVALMDAALAAGGPERISLLSKVGESAKRYGNMLEERHIDRLIEMGRSAPGDEATAAAAVMGSLDLPNSDLVPMILNPGR
jgi:HEAT repeat protein